MRRFLYAVSFGLMMVMAGTFAVFALDADEVAEELAAVAAWEASPVFADAQPPAPTMQTAATLFFSDFESDDGGLTPTLDWEWGTSYAWIGDNCYNTSYNEPPAPYSGAGMWATVMNNCYTDLGNNQGSGSGTCNNTNPDDDSVLTLTVDLTDYTDATLTWYEWLDVFSYFDWTEVRINNTSETTYCPPDYVAPTAWVQQNIDLTPYVGGMVTVEWHFMSSTVVNYAGWYIDDVQVEGTQVPVEVQAFSVE